ncbi:MAG: protein-methionine-sulfoxide reductase heme-binding subunit MsrQ [Paraburkholderia sp.]|nr:MAG: protein-methionine-sulfoxide reductase heme-binding subunit MsrQ [Paraburkholderia sp.]
MSLDTQTLTGRDAGRGQSGPRPVRSTQAGSARARGAADRWIAPAKIGVFVAALLPLARVVLFGFTDRLGANPIEFITRSTGLWTLVFLCITLTVTPLRRLSGVNALLRFRRMLGLYAFFYATLHFTTYIWFDKWFDVVEVVKDIGKRPFITVGFAAFLLLIPLAATSPRAVARRLGRRWLTLHRAIYAIAALAILHFWWMKAGKHDLILPKIYGAIVIVLLGWRVAVWARGKLAGRSVGASKPKPAR